MSTTDQILIAYHRAISRERQKTGVSWPLSRASCINDDGTITDTNRFDPTIVARWSQDSLGRIRIRLI